jgi:hypothetical protein
MDENEAGGDIAILQATSCPGLRILLTKPVDPLHHWWLALPRLQHPLVELKEDALPEDHVCGEPWVGRLAGAPQEPLPIRDSCRGIREDAKEPPEGPGFPKLFN